MKAYEDTQERELNLNVRKVNSDLAAVRNIAWSQWKTLEKEGDLLGALASGEILLKAQQLLDIDRKHNS